MTVADKVAVVTGAGSGMGLEAARLLAEGGARVVLVDVRADAAAAAAGKLAADGLAATAEPLDVTDRDACAELVSRTAATHGSLDVLVNCAGLAMSFTPIDELDPGLYQKVFDVNVHGTFHLCQAAAPVMRAQERGSIVNISSAVAQRPRPGLTAYVAAKAAVIGLTRSLALELAKSGVRVNCITPGATDTPMLPHFIGLDRDLEAGRAMYIDSIPMGRLATSEDIARGIRYLASDDSAFVTGEVLAIDGGRGV